VSMVAPNLLAPSVSVLISQLLPWLSPLAGSEQQHTTDTGSPPPGSPPLYGEPLDSPNLDTTFQKVPNDYPHHSHAAKLPRDFGSIPRGYGPEQDSHGFEFGADYVSIPPGHSVTIFFNDDQVLGGYDENDDELFKIKSWYPLRTDTTGPNFRRFDKYLEFGPGTFRVMPAHRPWLVNLWSPPKDS